MWVSSSRVFVSAEKVLWRRFTTSSSTLHKKHCHISSLSSFHPHPSTSEPLISFKSTSPPDLSLNGSGCGCPVIYSAKYLKRYLQQFSLHPRTFFQTPSQQHYTIVDRVSATNFSNTRVPYPRWPLTKALYLFCFLQLFTVKDKDI